jgi:hypothetical protein
MRKKGKICKKQTEAGANLWENAGEGKYMPD